MRKMSAGVVTFFVVGLMGLACSDQSGLNPPVGGAGGGNGAKGGQAGSVVGGRTAGAIGTGGVAAGGSGGMAITGGTPATGGTTGCSPIACPAIACMYGYLPSTDPCGCGICAPPPDAGVVKDAGGPDGRICLALPCAMPICPGGYITNPDPCGCPVCAADGGTATDGGKKDGPPICPPVSCPMLACVGGFVPNPDPCGCPMCGPIPDAGVAKDVGVADARPICPPVMCPQIMCVGGSRPNPDPCGCPLCGPAPDAGVAKDSGGADTSPPACPMLASLNSTDVAPVGYTAARGLFQCTGGGVTAICVSNDATGCSGSAADNCTNLCSANQYGLGYGGVGPLAPPPSIALPAGCGQGMYTPGGVAFYCCPCGT